MSAGRRTLWIVNHHAARPGESAAGMRHFLLARELRGHGWDTVIIAGGHEHTSGASRVPRFRTRHTESVEGVEFRWLRVPRYESRGIKRVLAMIAFWAHVVFPGATRGLPRPDAVIGSSVHPLAAHAALLLARRRSVPFLFEIRDLWPETLIQMGALRRDGLAARLLARLERHLCSASVRIITTMPHAVDYLQLIGVRRSKVTWLSNGVDSASFPVTEPPEEGLRFMYFGSLGAANGVQDMIESFLEAQLPDATFLLVGQGPQREAMEQLVAERGAVATVRFQGPVERSEVPQLATRAHCLVAAVLDLPLYDYGISLNKLFEYMAMSRPVLFLGHARGNPVAETGGGLCTDGSRASNVAAFAAMGVADRDLLARWGKLNRDSVVETFDTGVLASRLAVLLDSAAVGQAHR